MVDPAPPALRTSRRGFLRLAGTGASLADRIAARVVARRDGLGV